MHYKFKFLLFFITFLSLIFFGSCRKEEIKLVNPSDEKALLPNSIVASLMQRTALLDGSADNIIDKANCITIKLPVTVTANGIQVVVNTTKYYDVIESIFDDDSNDIDVLSISFPITLILENYSEVLINSYTELNNYVINCKGENEDDDDIECIDFNYPITATTYNTLTDKIDAISIENDKELYTFIKELNTKIIVNIIFPISATLFDNTIVTVENLNDLKMRLEDAVNACDEDDDFDYNDDDNTNLTEQQFKDLLTTCKWEIEEIEINDQDLKTQFQDYHFTFNVNGTVTSEKNGIIYNGTWVLTTNSGLRLSLQFNDFPQLNKTWRVSEINDEDDGTRLDLRSLEDHMKLKHDCD